MPVRNRVEIDDSEFERCLEVVFEMWGDHRDTVDIARRCNITEAQAEYILVCIMDANLDALEDARTELCQYFGNKNWGAAIIDQIGDAQK